MILYIHGFNSSPQSLKAQQTAQYLSLKLPHVSFVAPQIPPYPTQAINFLENFFIENQKLIKGIVGSSLGGYLASYFVEKYSVKSVLVNPAVRPYELLSDYLGEQTNPYTNERYHLQPEHMSELLAIDTPAISRHHLYWLLQQEGDEVLDHTQAVSKYAGCKQTVEAGGDHSFQGYQRFLPDIVDFFGLR
ncbi:MAG: putative esterase YcpF (UPF0227 family) [Alteromonadaceae bacterium]|jgi:predicted esterase YcpF (UPF0227 family)